MDNIKFNLPGIYYGRNIYQKLLEIKEFYPEYCIDFKINSVFGSLPGMTWIGGGCGTGQILTLYQAEEICNIYDSLDIPVSFTLTNPLLTKEDCYDRYCNAILKIFDTGKNEILVNSPIIEEYIRDKYPNYKINKSILAAKVDYDYIDALKYYNNIVIPIRLNKNFDFLNSIPLDLRKRIEILVNEPCEKSCPRKYTHYEDYGRVSLYETCQENNPKVKCTFGIKNAFERRNSPEILPFDVIMKDYYSIGYNNFKISGRLDEFTVAFAISDYLFKPEHKLIACNYLLES